MQELIYIVRLDDACPTMHRDKWGRLEEILERFNIKPIVTVIPDNKDEDMKIDSPDNMFWEKVRKWQQKGWIIGLHGFDHFYVTDNPGIIPLNKQSEFAGVDIEIQREKIRKGVQIFKSHGVTPQVWVAPSHSFDMNTLQVLWEETNIRIISDGIAIYPYVENNFFWIPQQNWRLIRKDRGIWTSCFHPNEMSDVNFVEMEEFLRCNRGNMVCEISSLMEKYSRRGRTLADSFFRGYFLLMYRFYKTIRIFETAVKKFHMGLISPIHFLKNEKIINDDDKTLRHYKIEKDLADRLRNSSRIQRRELYKSLYNELFRRVPWHSLLIKKQDEEDKKLRLRLQLEVVEDFISGDTAFMEIGAGDCILSFDLTKRVKKVYAIDVSDEIVRTAGSLPSNFQLIISDGVSIDVPRESIDVAYSNQWIEHIHVDDIDQHFKNVWDSLTVGGKYIFLTPHRFTGPHDVSRYFDRGATGFHLKEWTFTELISILQDHEYSKINMYCIRKGIKFKIPVFLIQWIEYVLDKLPYIFRIMIASILIRGRYYFVAER